MKEEVKKVYLKVIVNLFNKILNKLMNNLPKEINQIINEYLLADCQECHRKVLNFKKNITTVYNVYFDDDFPFPRIHKSYDYLCLDCIEKLQKERIVVYD